MKKQMSSFFLLLISATLCSCTVRQGLFDGTTIMSNEDSDANQGVPLGELTGTEESESLTMDNYTGSYTEDSHDSSSAITDEISCTTTETTIKTSIADDGSVSYLIESIPPSTSDQPFIEVNNNIPFFELSDYSSESFEYYSPLDDLGRCGVCVACIGQDMMPTEKRGSIGMVKPSGWQLVRYDGIVDGNYLFNRCHLIGYQLTGENANTSNLITGTRYMNTMGMLPFENETADYVHETGNHVLYRVTPYFEGDNLLVTGVLMEAKSVEDNGTGVMFNVFCYNIQPQIHIDYNNCENGKSENDLYDRKARTKLYSTTVQ